MDTPPAPTQLKGDNVLFGVIKNLNYERGFGFATADNVDYFFHQTALADAALFDELRKGDTLLLVEVENGPKGWRATSVVPQAAA